MQDLQLDENRKGQLDGNIRKMLEGGATQDDVIKYANDFKSQFGQKKNPVGNASVSGTTPTSPFVSPSKSISTQGTDLTNNNFFKEISQPVPPELQKRHEEALNRIKQINTQPKPTTPIQKFDNMAASVLGFNKDITESVKPSKRAEIEHDSKGHWGNIVQNVFANIEKAGTKLAAGTLQLISDMEQGKPSAGVKMPDNPMDKLIAGLNGNEKRMQQVIENNPLPNTFMGNAVESVSSFLPDIMGTALLPEAKLAQGAGLLKTAASAMFGNFTKYMAGKGLLEGYGAARQEGKDIPASFVEGAKESGRGALTGMEMGLLGLGSGMATNAIMKKAAEAGLTGAKGVAAKELVNLATDVTAYGLVSPTVHAGIEGRFPAMKEISDGTGIALLFRAKGTLDALKSHSKLNKALEETQNLRQGAAISNFVDADREAIQQVYEMPETATELNIKAFEAAKKAKDETDLQKKQKYVAEAILYTKSANVKSVTERILENPETIENLKNSDIPDNLKEQLIQKAQEVTDLLKPKVEEFIKNKENDLFTTLQQMQQESSKIDGAKEVQELSQRIYEELSKQIPEDVDNRGEIQRKLQDEIKNVFGDGADTQRKLRDMSESELRNASRRLYESIGGEVALQPTSQASSQAGALGEKPIEGEQNKDEIRVAANTIRGDESASLLNPTGGEPIIINEKIQTEIQQPTEAKGTTVTEVSEVKPTAEEGKVSEASRKYEEIGSIKTEKIRTKEKSKFVGDNFESIVSQLMLKNKIKRIC